MSFGKSTLGLMALTRIPGKHLLLVDTQLLREQWIEKFREFAPRVEVRQHVKPVHSTVSVFEPGGEAAHRGGDLDAPGAGRNAGNAGPLHLGQADERGLCAAARGTAAGDVGARVDAEGRDAGGGGLAMGAGYGY